MLEQLRVRRPAPGTVLGGIALMVALSGVAVAAIPGSDGTVAACHSPNGSLRVIDAEAGESCRSNETTVSLALTGPGGKVADADKLDGKDSSEFLTAATKVADADKLDGKDSTEFGRVIFDGTHNTTGWSVSAGSCRQDWIVLGTKYTDKDTGAIGYESGVFGPEEKLTVVQGRLAPTLVLTSEPTATDSMPGGGNWTQTNYGMPITWCNVGSEEANLPATVRYAVLDTES